ncbi:MAG TPA: hypothetical protein VH112_14830 [Acidimicrobiales bacterium]|jgi:hypothetical protein|nr:hypothetical protein [Acidimicrobiales bacterium]
MSRRGRIGAAALTLAGMGAAATSCATSTVRSTAPRAPATVALVSWGRQHADLFSTLSYDTSTVAEYTATYNTTALVGACQTVWNDVQQNLALPPIPDVVAAGHLRAALDLFGRGTSDCIAGSVHNDGGLIVQAGSELDGATTQLEATHSLLRMATKR